MKLLHETTIVNLALNLPGPAAARRLYQLGARVIKVEPPFGDPMKHYNADWYREMAAGHELVELNLKSDEDCVQFDTLLKDADLLITATRPAALDRLDLGWEDLHRKFPRLCQVAIVGYPAPRDNEAGHDLTYQASLGLLNPPHMPRTLLADMAGAELAVSTALALLLAREQKQEGLYAQVALSQAAETMAEPLRFDLTVPGALLGGGIPEYNIYQTRDGWAAVAALEPHFKKRLEKELGCEDEGIEQYRIIFKTKTAVEWQDWGQKLDIPIVAIKGVA